MAIPNVSRALRGWMKNRSVVIITKNVVNHLTVETSAPAVTIKMNIQPMPQENVNRKPEDQRSWKWWSIWIQHGPLLKVDDKITVDDKTYRIEVVGDWTEGGYQFYEAVEDYS